MIPLYDKKTQTYTLPNGAPTDAKSVEKFVVEAIEHTRKAGTETTFLHKGNGIKLSLCTNCTKDEVMDKYKEELAKRTPDGIGQGKIEITSPQQINRKV
jgi:hypothetical protein